MLGKFAFFLLFVCVSETISAEQPNSISKIPINVFQDCIEPYLSARDMVSLAETSRHTTRLLAVIEQSYYRHALANHPQELAGLPDAWRTEKRVYKLIKQASEITKFPEAFGYEILNFLAARGVEDACRFKFYGLREGRYGYKKDKQLLALLLRQEVEKGTRWALEELVCAVCGDYVQRRPFATAFDITYLHDVIEVELTKGNPWAFITKFNGLAHGRNGYERDPDAASKLLHDQATQDAPWAMPYLFDALVFREYGYAKDKAAARGLLDREAEKGTQWAVTKKAESHHYGAYGYERNDDLARALIDAEVEKGAEWAIRYKFEQVSRQGIIYPIDPAAGYSLLEDELGKGRQWVYDLAFFWFYGTWGKAVPPTAHVLFESEVKKRNYRAVKRKFERDFGGICESVEKQVVARKFVLSFFGFSEF